MRKLINGASIVLIFIIIYGLLTTVFDAHPVKSTPAAAVAPSASPSPNVLLVSTTPTPDPTQESTPTPTPVSTPTPVPLQSRVVKHQPDQFRKGGTSKEELSAIKKAIEAIPWSRNSNPKAAADEDYAAIVKECEKSSAHDLLADLITEAASNDYQPNNDAANGAYFAELNSDYENGQQSDRSSDKSTDEINEGKMAGVDSGLAPRIGQPDGQTKATSLSPAQQPASPTAIRPKIRHRKAPIKCATQNC